MSDQAEETMTIQREHGFNEQELERLRQKWIQWPVGTFHPYNEDDCVRRAVQARHYQYDGSPSYWADLSVVQQGWETTDGVLSQKEAHFWFEQIVQPKFLYGDYEDPEVTMEWVRDRMGALPDAADCTPQTYFDEMEERRIFDDYYGNQQVLGRLLRELVTYSEALEFLAENIQDINTWSGWVIALGPPPSSLRKVALEVIAERFDGFNYANAWLNLNVAKMLNMIPHQEAIEKFLEAHVEQKRHWDSDVIEMAYHLDDRAKSTDLLRRVKRRTYSAPTERDIHLFFAHFGFEEIDILFKKLIYHYRKKGDFRKILKEALKIKAPEVVEVLYSYLRNSNLKPQVEEYILTAEPYALEGLLRLAHSRSKKLDWSLSMMRQIVSDDESKAHELREMAEALHPKRVREKIAEEFFASDDEVAIRASIEYMTPEDFPEWMAELSEVSWPEGDSPDWLRPDSLPPQYLKDSEQAIPVEVVNGLLAAAQRVYDQSLSAKKRRADTDGHTLDEFEEDLHAFLTEVRPNCTQHLMLELMRAWDATQSPEHGQWVLKLAGERGGVAVTASLDHYIREQRDYSARKVHAKDAKLAIDILYELDTPEARHDLMWQMEHLQDESLRKHAESMLKKYKEENDLDEEEFADTAVPTFGLERGGKRRFDFGTRQIDLIVQGRHDIRFQDPDSKKVFKRWPPQRKTDDTDMYSAARDQYMQISEPLRDVFEEQNLRMERSMLTGRSWRVDRWKKLIGDHPILGHLARRMLWKVVDATSTSLDTVAVVLSDAEGTFMDLDFEEIEPDPKKHHLALVHPIELDDDDRNEWVAQLADFEIIQPFDQLERPVYRIEDADTIFADFGGQLDERVLLDALETGWEPIKTGYHRCAAVKYLAPQAKSSLRIDFSGHLQMRSDGSVQKAQWGQLQFSQLTIGDSHTLYDTSGTTGNFSKAHPIAFSEAIHLITQAHATYIC